MHSSILEPAWVNKVLGAQMHTCTLNKIKKNNYKKKIFISLGVNAQ